MDKSLLKEFKEWFAKYKHEKRKNWYREKCDVMFFTACKTFERLLEKTERSIDGKIDKEIQSKKQDRPTVLKAKRLSKGKNVESKYIDLRFEKEWNEVSEDVFEPFIASTTQSIIKTQEAFDKNKDENTFKIIP